MVVENDEGQDVKFPSRTTSFTFVCPVLVLASGQNNEGVAGWLIISYNIMEIGEGVAFNSI